MKVDEVLGGVRDAMTVKRVFGEPYERDGVTVIPVATVSGGGGGGGDNVGNGGGGFGLGARAIGAYVIRNGEVSWQPAFDVGRLALIGLVALFLLRGMLPWRGRRRRRR